MSTRNVDGRVGVHIRGKYPGCLQDSRSEKVRVWAVLVGILTVTEHTLTKQFTWGNITRLVKILEVNCIDNFTDMPKGLSRNREQKGGGLNHRPYPKFKRKSSTFFCFTSWTVAQDSHQGVVGSGGKLLLLKNFENHYPGYSDGGL